MYDTTDVVDLDTGPGLLNIKSYVVSSANVNWTSVSSLRCCMRVGAARTGL